MKPGNKRGLRQVLVVFIIMSVAAFLSYPGLADTIMTPYLQAVTPNTVSCPDIRNRAA